MSDGSTSDAQRPQKTSDSDIGRENVSHKQEGSILSKAPVSPGQATAHSDDDAQLPHERDESVGGDATGGLDSGAAGEEQRRLGSQAAADLAQGQVDTDMRATPGLDADRRESMTGPSSTPPRA